MRRLAQVIAAIALAIAALGIALLPLEMPAYTRVLASRVSEVRNPVALDIAESTRGFVVTGGAEDRAVLDRTMPPGAVSHLDDVRRVLDGARRATVVLLLAVAVWTLWLAWRRDLASFGRALRIAAGIAAAFVVLAGLAAVSDFDRFFSAFHGVFFAAGTWEFPSDSLLIRLFPEPFWTAAGLSWAAVVLLVAAAYWAAGWWIERSSAS